MKLLEPSEYQAAAGAVYLSVVQEIARLLPDAQAEHIGASAIPGAVSKGDLDICVLVTAQEHARAQAKGRPVEPRTDRDATRHRPAPDPGRHRRR